MINIIIYLILFAVCMYIVIFVEKYHYYFKVVIFLFLIMSTMLFAIDLRRLREIKEDIEKIKDVKIKSEFKVEYSKYDIKKFQYITDSNIFLNKVLTQIAKEEGYITDVIPEMKDAVKIDNLPLGVLAEREKIEKTNGIVEVYKVNNIYYLQFKYNYAVTVYKKIVM